MSRRLLLLVATIVMGLGLTACDWPQYMLGPSHTGDNTLETTVSVSNVSKLAPLFRASVQSPVDPSPPVVANGVVYMNSYGVVWAYDATGKSGCSGTPNTCAPLWTYPLDLSVGVGSGSPAVVNGVLYVGGTDGVVYAFDAAGNMNCSGTPKVCSPLWTATIGQSDSPPSVTVANGKVYVASFGTNSDPSGSVYVYDAGGTSDCSGTPKVCTPLWTADAIKPVYASPTIDGSYLYVATGGTSADIQVFDANGIQNCTGTPTVCSPLWTDPITDGGSLAGASVANGDIYAMSLNGTLYAFDASGQTNCSGTPVSCHPLWTAQASRYGGAFSENPTVGNGRVYVAGTVDGSTAILAFDANGNTNCTGSPKTCSPVWTYSGYSGGPDATLALANGVLYAAGGGGFYNVLAYDASGTVNCAGTPKVCTALWGVTNPGQIFDSGPALINGTLYVDSNSGLYAFDLPA